MDKIDIVTVEREYGCGGGEIAKELSERLGWKLWDHQLTEEIARLANCPETVVKAREERNDPLYYRLFKSFLRGSFEGSINAHKLKMVDSECILQITKQVVEHIGKSGNCVIVGRGAQHFLENRPGTLRVFLYAPTEDKVRRLIARGKSEAEARELVETVDRDRIDYIQKYFNVEWPTRELYHLMINTSVGNEIAVEAIMDFTKVLAAKH
jgi:cytidylate kinase